MLYIPYPFKVCSKCGGAFLPNYKFFQKGTNRERMKAPCKFCLHKQTNEYAAKNREKAREYSREYYQKNARKVIERSAQYRAQDPERWRAYFAQYGAEHKEQVAEYGKRWYEANREHHLQTNKRSKDANREHYRELCRKNYREHKDRYYDRQRRKRAARRLIPGSHTFEDVLRQFDRQGGRCYWCSELIDEDVYHVDHVIPLSRGGSDDPDNLVCACPHCNLSKGDRLAFSEWSPPHPLMPH